MGDNMYNMKECYQNAIGVMEDYRTNAKLAAVGLLMLGANGCASLGLEKPTVNARALGHTVYSSDTNHVPTEVSDETTTQAILKFLLTPAAENNQQH